MLDGRRRLLSCVAVEPGATVDPSAHVEHSLVAEGARVEADARVIGSVILPGAVIRRGADVVDSIVMGEVGESASLRDSVIGAQGNIAAGVALSGALIPDPSAA